MNIQEVVKVDGDYDVIVGKNLLEKIGFELADRNIKGKVAIITDSNVEPLFAAKVLKSLAKAKIHGLVITIPAGEASKSMNGANFLLNKLAEFNFNRDDAVLALGGGVVGDLAGFVASMYLRGINLIQVPTTVMAQVDSSIGGKTGVNLEHGKNLVGAFYNPRVVICDISTLKTLPKEEFHFGISEIIKYGLLSSDVKLFERLEKKLKLTDKDLPDIILQCIKIKAAIVTADSHETKNERIKLNLGHTIGHAIEQATAYKKYNHGEAVAFGLRAISFICMKTEDLSYELHVRIVNALKENGFKVVIDKHIPTDAVVRSISIDKKTDKNQVQWVMIQNLGQTNLKKITDTKLITDAVEDLKREFLEIIPA